MSAIPLIENKSYERPSLFEPLNLLREARRQKKLADGTVPALCVLDPDGDLAGHLQQSGRASPNPHWACYHTQLLDFDLNGSSCGIVPYAVGAPFAILVAEELFAAGCRLLVSITSAGQIASLRTPPFFILIERALRDEGASCHYMPPARYDHLRPEFAATLPPMLTRVSSPLEVGAVWTTDAPFRETQSAIDAAKAENLLAVEMEAAGLYALAEAKHLAIVCFAHVTNQMGMVSRDFEKGAYNGAEACLDLLTAVSGWWQSMHYDK